ncbi:orotidine-5'-phosphate decarboxylase [Candidatus Roizmanbacteria bacterium CG_4_10_14_0_2_um_filter_36_35]|uniref:Orotidine-5'-phosphate decarboxylase n=1 Tax=Candidatus Roizmanbacteria bacterium CG_4_10_14_0_2_um_filter_36_35 TaxID=1974822 RepID=A0A2M7UAF4_9BACT|nr:MAG: orotidine-5'-phosphate decarboxylase [Candidatus Roizmanbacteria bacterium CG_4_10_14_0_2_um_filter_36_35]
MFNKPIIEATHDLVCSYKLNTAFYEAIGYKGVEELKKTCDYLKKKYPEIPIIIDAKRGDIGSTNSGYVQFIFTYLGADAVTVQPYLGEEAIKPFLDYKDKGIIILCRTSNKGAGEFQNLHVIPTEVEGSFKKIPRLTSFARNDIKLYQYVAYQVSHKWNKNKNCLLVVGATYPDELREVRKITGDEITFLVPGIGAQGGDLEATLKAGLNSKKQGLIINSSRGIIFAKNPREEAKKLKEAINNYRK